MMLSADGRNLIKSFESLSLDAYLDRPGGKWTIGWGHTGPDVRPGDQWTEALADAMLTQDVAIAEHAVNNLVTVPLTQNEFDALVSFVFNVGGEAFANSTLLALLNKGDYAAAAQQFERWDHDGAGGIVAGLLKRRITEEDEFDGDDFTEV